MDVTQPEFIYIALVLPLLFALTLIAEGVHKMVNQESGLVSMSFGLIFVVFIIGTFIFVLQ